jgi:hypothetical protein
MRRMVGKEHSIAFTQAQEEISSDRVAAYLKYVGERKPFVPATRRK